MVLVFFFKLSQCKRRIDTDTENLGVDTLLKAKIIAQGT